MFLEISQNSQENTCARVSFLIKLPADTCARVSFLIKFRQTSIVFEKPGILSENLKNLVSSNHPTVQCFLLKFCTCFVLSNVYERLCGISFILFRPWGICKNLKKTGFYTLAFNTFMNNSRSKENKKNHTHAIVDITK